MSKTRSDILIAGESFKKASLSGKCAICLSSWFGTGLLPGAPGTFGTLASLPLVLFLNYLGDFFLEVFALLFIPLAVWSSHSSGKILKQDDPPLVVIDEVAGFLLTLFLVPLSWFTLCTGFILFRIFDILKPFPIWTLERSLKGGLGIVADDLMAGVYANLSLRVFLFLLHTD